MVKFPGKELPRFPTFSSPDHAMTPCRVQTDDGVFYLLSQYHYLYLYLDNLVLSAG